MKIFRIGRHAGVWPEKAAAALATPEAVPAGVLPVRLIADSAAVRNNRPVFVPDFAREGWVAEVLPAVHIGRLGKFISPRFAHRHISGFSLVVCLRRDGESLPDALTDSFDGAITLGEVIPLPPEGGRMAITARFGPLAVRKEGAGSSDDAAVAAGSERVVEVELPVESLHMADTVALLSRYATLKSGDVILPASADVVFPVMLDHHITAEVDGREVLTMRLK